MDFRKISMNQGGFKGAEIHFFEEEEKGGRKQIVLTKKYPKNPVHMGLEKLFKDLRPHLLYICRIIHDDMDKGIINQIISETSVQSVEMGVDLLVLKGEQLATDSKYITLKTYKIEQGDGYEKYDELVEIVGKICEETEAYMNGTKVVDDVEVAIRWVESGNAKGVNIDEIKSLSPEKLGEWAQKLLENNFGKVVLSDGDYTTGEGIEEAIEELQDGFEVTDQEMEVKLQEEEKTVKAKKEKVVTPAAESEEEF